MVYKITYDTSAILSDGSIGNISQGINVCYVDSDLSLDNIEKLLVDSLKKKKLKPYISKIEKLRGHILIKE